MTPDSTATTGSLGGETQRRPLQVEREEPHRRIVDGNPLIPGSLGAATARLQLAARPVIILRDADSNREETVITETTSLIERFEANISEALMGKPDVVRLAVVALVAEGHLLIEDAPGVGKTSLAKAFAKSLDCTFTRLQCTPDMLPSDILGTSVFLPDRGEFEFRPGPIFTNFLLVDEVNRTTPRTQSALLEAMMERQVTVDGRTYPLEGPFFVVATQTRSSSREPIRCRRTSSTGSCCASTSAIRTARRSGTCSTTIAKANRWSVWGRF